MKNEKSTVPCKGQTSCKFEKREHLKFRTVVNLRTHSRRWDNVKR